MALGETSRGGGSHELCLGSSMVYVTSGGKAGRFQDLITLQKPIFLKIGSCQLTHPTPSPSSVSKDACIFPGDKNLFGSENVEYLPKLDFCPQEKCFSQWNVLYPLTVIFRLELRTTACYCIALDALHFPDDGSTHSLELSCFYKNNHAINHKATG